MGKRVQKLLLTPIPVAFSLFLESTFVEVEEVSRDKLVRISRCKVPGRTVFSQPRLSHKNRSVLSFDRNHHVVKLKLEGKKLLCIRLCQRIAVGENHQIRLCSWSQGIAVDKLRGEFHHRDDRRIWKHQRLSHSVSTLRHALIIR